MGWAARAKRRTGPSRPGNGPPTPEPVHQAPSAAHASEPPHPTTDALAADAPLEPASPARPEPFPLVVEAQRIATERLLAEHGLSPAGVLAVAANAHDFAAALGEAAAERTEPKPACAAGCSWCCHVPVPASALDVLQAAAAVECLAGETSVRVRGRIAAAAARQANLEDADLLALREPCALLEDDGRCAIYEARPAACIGRNSPDPELCRLRHEEGGSREYAANAAIALVPGTALAAAAEALRAPSGEAGRVPDAGRPLPFIPALHGVLQRSLSRSLDAWLEGEPLFTAGPRQS